MAAQEAGFDIGELLRPEAFPHATTGIALRETHISWVILTGPCAYKIKKPVKAGFIDATTLELRRFYCEEELRLNGRLAPEIYLAVVPITRRNGQLIVGGTGSAVEYAVRMQQFPPEDELPALLATKAVTVDAIAALGALLGGFHLSLPAAAWTGTAERTARMLETVFGNLGQLQGDVNHLGLPTHLGRLADWSRRTADSLDDTFRQRERGGQVRECHGDLHLANIVRIAGRLVPFDCIDFDAGLRWIDVINDVAFLFMDLAGHDRPDLAFAMLSRYLETTGDYAGLRVLPFYAVYRALVRAKVDAFAAVQMPDRADEFRQRLERRLHTAAKLTNPAPPTLVIMHGVSGSGKSWVSERLVAALPALRIRSDIERKRMTGSLGSRVQAGVGKGLYSPSLSHRVYAHLADGAAACLAAGCSVIVDAAFLNAGDRELFQGLASRLGVPFLIVACEAAPDVLEARVAARAARGLDPSDATSSVLADQLKRRHPLSALEQQHAVVVDSAAADAIDTVLRKRPVTP